MRTWAVLLGLLILVGLHAEMILSSKDASKNTHAYIMLSTAALIAFGVFTG
jgi:hypothetical protein